MIQKKYNHMPAEDDGDILDAQERIVAKVRKIRSMALLDKLDDFISRIYRRGERR